MRTGRPTLSSPPLPSPRHPFLQHEAPSGFFHRCLAQAKYTPARVLKKSGLRRTSGGQSTQGRADPEAD
eukprot:309298-Chlamydomonas_euryale.AAC.1